MIHKRAADPEASEDGFTLIELLVVMIIIGILAAIAIPVFLNQQKKGNDASVKSDLRTVANEMNTFYTDNQTYVATVGTAAFTGTNAAPQSAMNTAPNVTIGSDTFTISKNDTIYVADAGTKGFCLVGNNSKGTTNIWYGYDSLKGGLAVSTATYTTAALAAAYFCQLATAY
jgi:type IV pilus assembly protein PilA